MELFDFSKLEKGKKVYGGESCEKTSVIFNNELYLVKFPGSNKLKKLKNVLLSYDNSPVSEYIGSNIYSILGLSAQQTILGKWGNEKIVVACKDFTSADNSQFISYQKILNNLGTFNNPFFVSPNQSKHIQINLKDIISDISTNPFLKDIPKISEHFWNMFVVDSLIGNFDRNNGNWGIIRHKDFSVSISPIFDNGSCFYNKWDDKKIAYSLNDHSRIETISYKGVTSCFFYNNKRINPFQFINKHISTDCDQALFRVVPLIKRKKWELIDFIDGLDPVLCSKTRKSFIKKLMMIRMTKCLVPAFEKAQELNESLSLKR